MRKQLMLLTTVSLLTWTGTAEAQSTLSTDFVFTDTVIVLLAEQAQAAGYPVWREVVMVGPDAVPYNYCPWLLAEKPWLRASFTTSQYGALENCANKISLLTQALLDDSAPDVATSGDFWTTRPEEFTIMLPDPGVTEAEFNTFLDSSTEEPEFVSDPAALAEQLLAVLELRVEALEDWRQSLADNGGVVTQDLLDQWAQKQAYLLPSDLPAGELVTLQQVEGLINSAVGQITVGISEPEARELFALKGEVTQTTIIKSFIYSLWWWLLLLVAALTIIGLILWWLLNDKVDKQRKEIDHADTGLNKAHELATAASLLAGNAMSTAKTGIQLGLPIGWEPIGDWPSQADLDALHNAETLSMRFVHDQGAEQAVEFTAVDEAFPQNVGKKQKGLLVSGQATSTKPVACRVGMLIRECCKLLESLDKKPIQPRDAKGHFVKVSGT